MTAVWSHFNVVVCLFFNGMAIMARAFRVSRPAEHLYFHHTCDVLSQPCNVPHNTVGQGRGFSVLLSFCWPLVHVEILAHSVSHHMKS